MLFIGIWMFIVGAWGGTYLSKYDKYKIYYQGYSDGFGDCQKGFLPEIPKIGIEPEPEKEIIENKNKDQDLKSKFRG